jgi:hypothetical protein
MAELCILVYASGLTIFFNNIFASHRCCSGLWQVIGSFCCFFTECREKSCVMGGVVILFTCWIFENAGLVWIKFVIVCMSVPNDVGWLWSYSGPAHCSFCCKWNWNLNFFLFLERRFTYKILVGVGVQVNKAWYLYFKAFFSNTFIQMRL